MTTARLNSDGFGSADSGTLINITDEAGSGRTLKFTNEIHQHCYIPKNNAGLECNVHYIYITGSSSSTTNVNFLRVKKHWWGTGNYIITTYPTYYGYDDVNVFQLNSTTSEQYNGVMSAVHYSGNDSGRIGVTTRSTSSPGDSTVGYCDVYIVRPAYWQYVIKVEVQGVPYSETDSVLAGRHNSYRVML